MKLSIVIICWNDLKVISDCLRSIYEETKAIDFEVIVSDNGSSDGSLDFIRKHGDCVLLDIGCRKDMYCADMTRTYFAGYVPERMLEIYEAVRRAGDLARGLVRPGVPLKDIDDAARGLIERAGYGPNFTHRLGHFIGLGVHEAGAVPPEMGIGTVAAAVPLLMATTTTVPSVAL